MAGEDPLRGAAARKALLADESAPDAEEARARRLAPQTNLAAVDGARRRAERAIRSGLALDAASAPLRSALQALRDVGFALDARLEPIDAALADAPGVAAFKAAGADLFAKGQLEKAAAQFALALARDPTDGVLWSNRSACLAGLGRYGLALRDADACVERRPAWAKAHNRRATALFGIGRYPAAVDACADGLATDPAAPGNGAGAYAALELLKRRCDVEAAEPEAAQFHAARLRRDQRDRAALNKSSGLWTMTPDGELRAADLSNLAKQSPDRLGGLDALLRGAAAGNPLSEDELRAKARELAAAGD